MELGFRKVKDYFDTLVHPAHVTFDDGKNTRRNFQWMHYLESRWDYSEPGTIRVEIGECVITITGCRLGSLFRAIEEQTLFRVRAMPEFETAKEHDVDCFATAIIFAKATARHPFAHTPQPPRSSNDAKSSTHRGHP